MLKSIETPHHRLRAERPLKGKPRGSRQPIWQSALRHTRIVRPVEVHPTASPCRIAISTVQWGSRGYPPCDSFFSSLSFSGERKADRRGEVGKSPLPKAHLRAIKPQKRASRYTSSGGIAATCLAAARVSSSSASGTAALDLPRRSIHYQAPASQPSRGSLRCANVLTWAGYLYAASAHRLARSWGVSGGEMPWSPR